MYLLGLTILGTRGGSRLSGGGGGASGVWGGCILRGLHTNLMVLLGGDHSPTPQSPKHHTSTHHSPKTHTPTQPHTPHLHTPLRRHKLPSPHLALWPTEVHVVVRGKVCEKGCPYPLVATCKNEVCIAIICHYLHFWQDTDFQNKDIQSPKYIVVLHLDHCISVRGGGGGGLPIVPLPFVPG